MVVICGQLPPFHVCIARPINHVESPAFQAGIVDSHFSYLTAKSWGMTITPFAGLEQNKEHRRRAMPRAVAWLAGCSPAGLIRGGIGQVSLDPAGSAFTINSRTCPSCPLGTWRALIPFPSLFVPALPVASPLKPYGGPLDHCFWGETLLGQTAVWALQTIAGDLIDPPESCQRLWELFGPRWRQALAKV